MKKEKGRRKQAVEAEHVLLPPPIRTPAFSGAPFTHNFVWSGKIAGERTVAFRVILPSISNGESAAYFESLRDAVLSFWKKESKKQGGEVWFGGLEAVWKEDHLALFFCFSPFSQREYRLCALICLAEEGAICGVSPPERVRKRVLPRWRRPQSP